MRSSPGLKPKCSSGLIIPLELWIVVPFSSELKARRKETSEEKIRTMKDL
jgi:hypothetical protein